MIFKENDRLFSLVRLVVAVCCFLLFPPVATAVEIDPDIEEWFATHETAGYVIYFHAKANLSGAPQTDWKEQSAYVNRALQENANRSQARVKSYLFDRRIPFRSVWKDNSIVVDRSDRDTFKDMKSFREIESIKFLTMRPKASPGADQGEAKGNGSTTDKP